MPNLADDEFYYSDLINLTVFDTGGIELGKVMSVNDHGAGDFLEIKAFGQKNLALLPFTKKSVPTVDLKLGRIIIDPPNGVFDNNEAEEPPSPKNYLELGDE
jgi:16S rRNA processing protein RimM